MSNQRYLVTARKYRPQTFDELVAQEHVSGTLKNAIRLDRLAHAYLFSGPRGVGKTTAARILAKAINCTTPLEERVDGAEPCRTCDSCRSFEEGRSLNIIEIDAASNNKVEDIRELRETVRIPPQGSRKKVYIVDEVHMLSNAAFNALLKTLEEPPPHVLFIFATTEPHKVLPTILSRCQRFDFRRIPVPEIVGRLRTICTEEGITADEASLMLVARKGDGALRDALSAFDQAVSLCGTDLTYSELAQALGVVEVDLFFEVTGHVAGSDAAGMLTLVDRIVRAGTDLQEFLVGLAEHLRNLLVARSMGDTALIEAAEATRERYAAEAGRFTEHDLMRLLTIVAGAEEAVKGSTQPRLKLEMALLNMATLPASTDLRRALTQLDRLEKLAREGKLPAAPPAEEPAPRRAPEKPERAPEQPAPARQDPPQREAAAPDPPETPQPPTSTVREPQAAPPAKPQGEASTAQAASQPAASRAESPSPSDVPGGSPRPAETEYADGDAGQKPPADYPSLFGAPALRRRSAPREAAPDRSRSSGAADDTDESDTAPPPSPAPAAAADPALRAVEAAWARYVRVVKQDRIHVGSLLQHTSPAGVEDDTLVLGVPDDFHRRLLGNQHDFLCRHLRAEIDETLAQIRFVVHERPVEDVTPDDPGTFDPHAYMQRKRQDNPVVKAIFEQFGGELVW